MWDAVRKTKKLIAGLLLALLLAGGQAFASNVTGAGNTTTSGTAMAVNATFNVTLQEGAYYMLTLLDGVANYTADLMGNMSTIDNETSSLYAEAENLRQSAWAAYDMANYSAAITIAMNAMETYELVIERAMPANTAGSPGMNQGMGGMGNGQEALYWAKIELQRAREYLAYVSRIIDEATKLGIDTSEISALYSQTVEAYNRVEADIENGDVSSLRDDMRRAESLRMQLEMAVESGPVRAILMASADNIAQTFMKKIEAELNKTAKLMEIISNLTANGTGTGMMNMLQMRQMEIQRMLEMVKSAVQAGQYERALYMIREINEELSEAITEINMAAMQFRDTYMGEYCGNYWSGNPNGTQDYPQYCNQSWWMEWGSSMMGNGMTGWSGEPGHSQWSAQDDWNMGWGMGHGMGDWNDPWWGENEHGRNRGESKDNSRDTNRMGTGNTNTRNARTDANTNHNMWGHNTNDDMSNVNNNSNSHHNSWNSGHEMEWNNSSSEDYWWSWTGNNTTGSNWSGHWAGNQNGTGNWTSNQTSSTNGNTTHGSMGDNHMNDDTPGGMDDMNDMDNGTGNQDNHMEDPNEDSGNTGGCGNCTGGGNGSNGNDDNDNGGGNDDHDNGGGNGSWGNWWGG